MSWIKTIDYIETEGKLKGLYDRVKGPNNIDNVLSLHGLRAHTLTGHLTLYKSVLHHSGNTLPKWYLGAIGVYVSQLNACSYCVDHHFEGLRRLLNDDIKANQFLEDVMGNVTTSFFGSRYDHGMAYAKTLTLKPSTIIKADIDKLRASGFSDGEILEINQVTSYFNYVNRSVLGLGITTKRDILGLSPNESDDPENWSHQ